jgi:lipopolysaccharide biosynthesis glycosyltransferase
MQDNKNVFYRKSVAIFILLFSCTFIMISFIEITFLDEIRKDVANLKEAMDDEMLNSVVDSSYYRQLHFYQERLVRLDDSKDFKLINDTKRSICRLKRDYAITKLEMAQAYYCLAEIDINEKEYLYAIRNLSYSIETSYSSVTEKLLNDIIHGNDYKNIAIESLAEGGYGSYSDFALYRLSLINLFGRENSNSKRQPNIKLAFSHKVKLLNGLKMDQIKEIPIVMSTNEKYATRFLLPSLISLLLNAELNSKYSIYIFYDHKDDPLSEKTIGKIKKLNSLYSNVNIELVAINSSMSEIVSTDAYKNRNSRCPLVMLNKVQLADLLSNFDKIIYLDVDSQIREDLVSVYETDINDYYAGVVMDASPFNQFYQRNYFKNRYWNSGFMLLNLKKIREEIKQSKILDIVKSHDKEIFGFCDQDILNVAYDKVFYLSPRWNEIWFLLKTKPYLYNFSPFFVQFANRKPDKANPIKLHPNRINDEVLYYWDTYVQSYLFANEIEN